MPGPGVGDWVSNLHKEGSMTLPTDPEGRFLKQLARFDRFEERLVELESDLLRLIDRVEGLEALGFQAQISDLDKRLNTLKLELLTIRRYAATMQVISLGNHWNVSLRIHLLHIMSPSDTYARQETKLCMDYIHTQVVRTKSEIKSSSDPEEEALKWQRLIHRFLSEHGLQGMIPIAAQ